jgi:hypothetical protein
MFVGSPSYWEEFGRRSVQSRGGGRGGHLYLTTLTRYLHCRRESQGYATVSLRTMGYP